MLVFVHTTTTTSDQPVTSLRQFDSTTDFVSYLVEFLIHWSPYYQNCFCLPILGIETVLEKIRKNCIKIVKHVFFVQKGQFLAVFSGFFSRKVLCRSEGCGFLCCVQCLKTLNLSYQKQHYEIFSNFSL